MTFDGLSQGWILKSLLPGRMFLGVLRVGSKMWLWMEDSKHPNLFGYICTQVGLLSKLKLLTTGQWQVWLRLCIYCSWVASFLVLCTCLYLELGSSIIFCVSYTLYNSRLYFKLLMLMILELSPSVFLSLFLYSIKIITYKHKCICQKSEHVLVQIFTHLHTSICIENIFVRSFYALITEISSALNHVS